MINFIVGNMLQAPTQALVNTVNTVGVMGKGIALQFKERFKHNFKEYSRACKDGSIAIGKLLVVRENMVDGEKLIINFPTKTEWFKKSQYSYIEEGLKDLVRVIQEYDIKSIAIPPLGCGNGGLDWVKVKPMMEKYLGHLPIEILIFEPNEAVKEILQKEDQKESKLSAARAMLLYALREYEKHGEYASVFVANKLAYFLQESGEPMRLQFVPYTYGPYAQAVEKVLYSMNGTYLTGLEQMTAGPFETIKLKYDKFPEVDHFVKTQLSEDQRKRLKGLFQIIEGFETTLSLEVLSSIHYLKKQKSNITPDELLDQIKAWNERKKSLIKKEYVDIALKHLNQYQNRLDFA